MTSHLPTLFVSHGAPTLAIEPGLLGPKLTALGLSLPRPTAVLVVSPHWTTSALQVGTSVAPDTIHDFSGFGPTLERLQYPAAGHPALARRTLGLLNASGRPAAANERRGLDHGAWVPLMHLYPQCDVPVFQVSLPMPLDGNGAWALGQALAPLADEGVLIMGSGSLTHNLSEVDFASSGAADYAVEFSAWIRSAAMSGDGERLRNALSLAPHARRSHPTPEHFWPLLVAAGAAQPMGPVSVIDAGVTYGVLSMDAFVFGAAVTS